MEPFSVKGTPGSNFSIQSHSFVEEMLVSSLLDPREKCGQVKGSLDICSRKGIISGEVTRRGMGL